MGYLVVGRVRTMMSRVMYKSKFIMGGVILRRVIMITCDILLKYQLANTRIIDLLVSGRDIVDGLGDKI